MFSSFFVSEIKNKMADVKRKQKIMIFDKTNKGAIIIFSQDSTSHASCEINNNCILKMRALVLMTFISECQIIFNMVDKKNPQQLNDKIFQSFDRLNSISEEYGFHLSSAFLKLKLIELDLIVNYR